MIVLKNVTKEYRLDGETSVAPVIDVSLEVQRGEFVMIVGRSGSGKTTLLNLCAGLIKPTAGQVLIDGQDIQALDEKGLSELRSTKLGFCFQSASMLPSLSVIENVAAPSMFARNGGAQDRFERAAEVLDLVGLGDRMEVLPRQLSGGELRRVAIARALMNRPEILLADEPTSDLDVQTELNIVGALQRINASGVTVLMVTHSLELVPYASRALKMENGTLVPLDDSPARGLRVDVEPAARSFFRRAPRSAAGRLSVLRSPVMLGYLGLGVALLAMTLAFGLMVGRSSKAAPTAAPVTTSSPGPVLPATAGGMGMGQAATTYDPTQYNVYGNTGLYSSLTMGVQWPLQVDPPPGDPLRDPPVLEDTDPDPDVFHGTLEARVAEVNLNGTLANLMTYNGSYPGPVIKVKRGDVLKIDFTNSLPATTAQNVLGYEKNHTNLHVHGLHVSPQDPGDNATLDIAPGEGHSYEYDLSLHTPGTLDFIHGHVHGLAAEQLWAGMLATILVEDEATALSSYESHILVLKDITLNGSEPQAHLFMSDYMFGKEGEIVTVNGQVNPVVSIRPGQVQRWRILNGSNARFYRVYLENHLLYLVGTDGGLLDKPYPVSSLLLAPGERADVLVKAATANGNYRLISLPYNRQMGMMGMGMMGMSMVGQTANMTGTMPTMGMGMMGMSSAMTGTLSTMGMGMMGTSSAMTGTLAGMGMGLYAGSTMANGAMSTLYDPSMGTMGMGMYGGMPMNGGAGMYGGMYNPGSYAYWPAVTGLLNLTTAQIQGLLITGQSLAEIAATQGISASQLVETILTQTRTNLDQYVEMGTLSRQQSAQQLAWMDQVIRPIMADKTWRGLAARMNQGGSLSAMSMSDPALSNTYGTCGSSTTTGTTGASSMTNMGTVGMCPGMIGTIGMGRYDMSASAQVTLLTLSNKGSADEQELPAAVNPAARRVTMDFSNLPRRVITFDMDMGNGYINGQDFDVKPYTVESQVGTYEIWTIINHSGMDHPFHMHVNAFQVLAANGCDADYAQLYTTTPAWKDVVIVPKMGSVTLLVPVQDYDGMTMFHCHILEHEDIGMMGMWDIKSATGESGAMGDMPATASPTAPAAATPGGMGGMGGMDATPTP